MNTYTRKIGIIPTAVLFILLTLTLIATTGTAQAETVTPLYLADSDGQCVIVINTADNTTITTIPTASDPHDVIPSTTGGRIYVIENVYPYGIEVFSTLDWSLIKYIPLTNYTYCGAITPDGSRLFFSLNKATGIVGVLDTSTWAISYKTLGLNSSIWTIADMTITPDGSKLIACGHLTSVSKGFVAAISANTYIPAWTNLGIGYDPIYVTASPSYDYYYVFNNNDSIASGETGFGAFRYMATAPAGTHPIGGIIATPVYGEVYVGLSNNSSWHMNSDLGTIGYVTGAGYAYSLALGVGPKFYMSTSTGGSLVDLSVGPVAMVITGFPRGIGMIFTGPPITTGEPISVTTTFQLTSWWVKKWNGVTVVVTDSAGRVVDGKVTDTQGKVSFVLQSGHQYTLTATSTNPAFTDTFTYTPDYASYSAYTVIPWNIDISLWDMIVYQGTKPIDKDDLVIVGAYPYSTDTITTYYYDPAANTTAVYMYLYEEWLGSNASTLLSGWTGAASGNTSHNFTIASPAGRYFELRIVGVQAGINKTYFGYYFWPGPLHEWPGLPLEMYRILFFLIVLGGIFLGTVTVKNWPYSLIIGGLAGAFMSGMWGWAFELGPGYGLKMSGYVIMFGALGYMYMKSRGTY